MEVSLFLWTVAAVYALFILQLVVGFGKVKTFLPGNSAPKTAFSIIIPFRNEAKNLPKLLASIRQLDYPRDLFELILVDDFSKDASEHLYIKWRVENDDIDTTLLENLRLSPSPKKDAIARAIPIVKHPWIITTDADCIVDPQWLTTLDQFIQQKPETAMVAGAVVFQTKNNWFHHFQQLELLALQGTTIGSFGLGQPFMCNGANFAYTKKLFEELGGFGGIGQPSGDDVLLLQKAVAHAPAKVAYLKNPNTIVKTKPANDLFKLFGQRVRWAGKTSGYRSTYAKTLAVVVLGMNLSLVLGGVLLAMGRIGTNAFFVAFSLKYLADLLLLVKANHYLREGRFFLPLASSVVYPLWSSAVGLYSLCFGFSWKGRRYKK